jgi:beta-glucanase (GH16 family)
MRFLSKHLIFFLIVVFLTACASPVMPVSPTETPTPTSEDSQWELIWEDDFEGETLDQENWIAETGAGGWGNNEWQHYTDRPENHRLEDGFLVIEARKEEYKGSDYTSARLKTQSLQAWTYGRMEARMKLPTGQGVWSAFWMLGEDFPTSGWPDCGEIDIMENIGEPRTVYGTVHGPGYSGGGGIGDSFTADVSLSEDFHTYAIEWEPGEIRWYLDDSLFNTITDTQVPGEWVYDHPFFLLLNLAIGGNWPGYPDETTQFPQQFVIDYVRVYRDSTLSIEDLQEGVLHADDITMTLEKDEEDWEAVAYVTVLDSKGDPVEGAMVAAGWLGVVIGATGEATTDERGVAGPFVGQKTSFADEVTFCIADIRKTSYTYDEDANTRTCIFDSP